MSEELNKHYDRLCDLHCIPKLLRPATPTQDVLVQLIALTAFSDFSCSAITKESNVAGMMMYAIENPHPVNAEYLERRMVLIQLLKDIYPKGKAQVDMRIIADEPICPLTHEPAGWFEQLKNWWNNRNKDVLVS